VFEGSQGMGQDTFISDPERLLDFCVILCRFCKSGPFFGTRRPTRESYFCFRHKNANPPTANE
jgi:hypothetical protein